MDDAQPFAGITVVEFGQFIAVPFCAQLLADGGARVVKVESLEGDPVRHIAPLAPGETRHYLCRNRGKHVLPLELKHPSAASVIEALLSRADVLLTNFRPGLAEAIGLDWASVAPRHPRLIVGSVTAFGRRGPDAMLAGMDLVVQARSGLMVGHGRLRDGLPAAGDPPTADYMCAMMLAFGIASALLRRERTGRGGEIDVSLLKAALTVQNNAMIRVQAVDGPRHAEALETLAALRARGAPYAEQAAVNPTVRTPAMIAVYYRTFATRDAALAVACGSPGLRRAFGRAVGFTDDRLGMRFPDAEDEARHYAELGAEVERRIAARTTAEWTELLATHGIPAAGVRLPVEMIDDVQALAVGAFVDLDHPLVGGLRMLATPVGMDGDGFRPGPATQPYGSETRALLGEIGFEPASIDALIAEGVTRDSFPGARVERAGRR
jgi:crotonobetainyl-CoA:carnitine CoA-transferase CaiB-like acyl-CoA transferase